MKRGSTAEDAVTVSARVEAGETVTLTLPK